MTQTGVNLNSICQVEYIYEKLGTKTDIEIANCDIRRGIVLLPDLSSALFVTLKFCPFFNGGKITQKIDGQPYISQTK